MSRQGQARSCGTAWTATRRPRKAEQCIRKIVEDRGGEVADVKFEPNGRWARVNFYWEDPRVKHGIVLDLQAQQVLDVISAEEMDALNGGDGSVT